MKIIAAFLIVASLATTINGMSLFLESKMSKIIPAWDNLKVTWGINPFSHENFVGMPLTEADAKAQGWTKEKSCGEVNGNRYMFMGDTAVLLIYNTHGNISGLATALPKGLPFNFPSKNIQKLFKDEGNQWTISSYFTDPTTVCSPSLSKKHQTGDRLVIQGDNNYQLEIPLLESNLTEFWTLGQCFYTMGVHYWADISGRKLSYDSKADDFVPMFLQYNKGHLNGFGWGFNADLPSKRFEHPTLDVLGSFFKEVPKFMADPSQAGTLTTLHIYLDSTPQLNFC